VSEKSVGRHATLADKACHPHEAEIAGHRGALGIAVRSRTMPSRSTMKI
jgi:hypothetical protein